MKRIVNKCFLIDLHDNIQQQTEENIFGKNFIMLWKNKIKSGKKSKYTYKYR